MKGNKLVIAVILALIVCLVLIPTCAFADGEQQPAAAENTGDNPAAGNSATGGDNSSNAPSGEGEGPNGEQNPAQQPEQPAQPVNQDEQQPGASGESGNVNPGDNDEDKNLSESGDKEEGNTTSGDNGDGAEAPKPGDSEGGEQPASGGKEQPEVKEPETSGEVKEDAKLEEGSDPGAESGGEEDTPASGAESSTADAALLTAPARAPANTGETLQSKIDKAKDGDTITLDKDYNESITIDAGKTITIDLNGKTLTNGGNNSNYTICNKGTLTIKDSSADKTGKVTNSGLAALVNEGTAILEGGTFTSEKDVNYIVKNYGEMTIGGDVKVKYKPGDNRSFSLIENGWTNVDGKTCGNPVNDSVEHTGNREATLTINGGTFSGLGYNVSNRFWGNLTINGGTFKGSRHAAVFNQNVAIINGGSFTGSEYQNPWCGTNEYGGVIQNEFVSETNSKGTMTITSGEFTSENGRNIWKKDYLGNSSSGGKITVSGGRFTGTLNSKYMPYNVNYTGGIYSDKNIENLVEEGCVVEANGWCAVNESGYDIANDGDTVTVIKAPAEAEIDDVPGGVTVKNVTENSIFINGVEVKPDESYTVPKPAASAAYAAPLYAKYFVIEGKEQQWTAGDIEFVLNSNAVIKVLIDGIEVEFTVAEDGTVTIAAEIIEALSDGEHEIKFIFADGSCKTTFTVK